MREVPITLLGSKDPSGGVPRTPQLTFLSRRNEMPIKGFRKSRLCRACGETDPSKFQARLATLCGKCRQKRYRGCIAKSRIRARDNDKIVALSHYSPNQQMKCSWDGCLVDDPDMLVLDHPNDDGAAQRRLMGGTNGKGHALYRWLRNKQFPEGFQTLCCNHNQKKEILRSRKHRFNPERTGGG